jgi:predicted neuraminidase
MKKLLLCLLPMTTILGAEPAVMKSEFIFDPNPVPSCHATTIVETKTGLVAAWFAGTAEGKPDVCIWSSRLVAGAWTPPVKVAEGTPHPCWNPVLFQPDAGPLLLFYKVGPSPSTWWGMLKTSVDNGSTWSEATKLPDGILGPIKNKPVQLADGTILCPTSTETDTKPSEWRLHFELTKDGGATWTTAPPVSAGDPAIDAIQPSILRLGGDRLLALGRTRQKKLFNVVSEDQGRTWGAMSLLELPNPNSGTDAVTLKDGRHLLIYNHTERGRSPLNLAVSRDGTTWNAALVLEDEPKMEFSYPAIIQTADGLVHATYTWKRKLVKHVVIDPAKLTLTPIVKGEWPQ